jgi:hypothetical protein
MDFTSFILTIAGLAVFESITSIDNAIINAEILATMGKKTRRWFLTWGILIAVFGVRGLLPWLIVWVMAPGLSPWRALAETGLSDIAKILYLEVIDSTFSIDGVVGAFAFTLSVPVILLGNGIGAVVVRQLTIYNLDKIKRYVYLKNGAMYSVLVLGFVMLAHGFGVHIPEWLAPVATIVIVGYFLWKSLKHAKTTSS